MADNYLNCLDATLNEFVDYLKTKLPPEMNYQIGWPGSKQQLEYPTLAIIPSDVIFHLIHPILHDYQDITGTIAQIKSLYKVADVEMPLQLDLWAMSDPQRKYYSEQFIQAMFQNPGRVADTNILLKSYYNVLANYQIEPDQGLKLWDNSNDIQQSEYRSTIRLKAQTDLLITKQEFKFVHLYLHTKVYIGDNIPVNVETNQIF